MNLHASFIFTPPSGQKAMFNPSIACMFIREHTMKACLYVNYIYEGGENMISKRARRKAK